MASSDAFISAVTSECAKARDAAASALRRRGLRVEVQNEMDYAPGSLTTLRRLHDLIHNTAEVHCIFGKRSGACPPAEAAAEFAKLLPPGITEASYTQWEYFFALRHAPGRVWLYIATDDYQPDQPDADSDNRPDLQAKFLDYLRKERGYDYAPFHNADRVETEVLHHHLDTAPASPSTVDAFHRIVAGNALGGFIAALLAAAAVGLLARSGGWLDHAVMGLALLLAGMVALAFIVIHQRYAAILSCVGPYERYRYAALRENLAAGGWAAPAYARRLRAALAVVDRFFGDADKADRTLFPRIFGLRDRAPLWTAAAFDRCLLLALLYPIATVFLVWAISGHIGTAEQALLLKPNVPGWQRIAIFGFGVSGAFCLWQANRVSGRRTLIWYSVALTVAIASAGVGANASDSALDGASAVGGAFAFAVTFTIAFVAAFAVAGAVAGADAVAGAIAGAVSGAGGFAVAFPIAGAFDVAVACAITCAVVLGLVVTFAVGHLNATSSNRGWQGTFQTILVVGLTAVCLIAAATLGTTDDWHISGPLLLFLGLLTLLNAPFDWASLGLTRALLRRGLELGDWWPYPLAFLDALAAAVIIALLTIVCVLGVQTFDTLAQFSGGKDAVLLPLGDLFAGIKADPTAPEYWWVYLLLLSTMIPSLVNLMIGGASLLSGIPWFTSLLLRNMPANEAPPLLERTWMTLLLTVQMFLGGLFGIAVQAALAYGVIGLLLPAIGWDLLDLARGTASLNLPQRLFLSP